LAPPRLAPPRAQSPDEWIYSPGQVVIDDVIDQPVDCFVVVNDRWNGWRMPVFTREQADRLVIAWNANEPESAYYDDHDDRYCFTFEDLQETDTFEGMDIEVNGEAVHVYPIGQLGWCWDDPQSESETA
jgi:hypothetical protein